MLHHHHRINVFALIYSVILDSTLHHKGPAATLRGLLYIQHWIIKSNHCIDVPTMNFRYAMLLLNGGNLQINTFPVSIIYDYGDKPEVAVFSISLLRFPTFVNINQIQRNTS